MKLSDYIAQTIAATGTDAFFMLSGGMMMHLMDSFGRQSSMRYFCHHHEQACAFAADAYARKSGKLGVCLATSGPGATNLLTGIVGSYQDAVPVIFLTGQCKRRETIRFRKIEGLRQCGFLEADIVPLVEPVTKYAAFIDDPLEIRYHLEKAIHMAMSGKPGPVLLDIPLDVQGASIDPEKLRRYVPEKELAGKPKITPVQLIRKLEIAKRPVIIAGHGLRVANQVEAFRSLITKWQIPVVTTFMAKDLLPYNHPLFMGHSGPRGNRGANFIVQASDTIVFMGASIHVQSVGYEGELFAPNAYKIQIDIDKALFEREFIGVDMKLNWDIADYLPKLKEIVQLRGKEEERSKWVKTCQSWARKYSSDKEKHPDDLKSNRLNLYEFTRVLNRELRGRETIMVDAGQPHPILGQAFQIKGAQRYINPGSLAQMGYALPASIGVAAADSLNNVIAVIGDGSLQTNIHELQTLVHYKPHVKLFVINNGGYASIKNTQENFFKGFYVGSTEQSGVSLPDTKKICRAYGLHYVTCDKSNAKSVIKDMLSIKGPVICEVFAKKDQKVLPAVASKLYPDGIMRSNALEAMSPEIGISFEELKRQLV